MRFHCHSHLKQQTSIYLETIENMSLKVELNELYGRFAPVFSTFTIRKMCLNVTVHIQILNTVRDVQWMSTNDSQNPRYEFV